MSNVLKIQRKTLDDVPLVGISEVFKDINTKNTWDDVFITTNDVLKYGDIQGVTLHNDLMLHAIKHQIVELSNKRLNCIQTIY